MAELYQLEQAKENYFKTLQDDNNQSSIENKSLENIRGVKLGSDRQVRFSRANDGNEVILAGFKNPPSSNHDSSLPAKKLYGEAEGIYVLPDYGLVNPDGDATVPVESIMGTVPSLKAQYEDLLKTKETAKYAAKAIKKFATGSMRDIKKIKGMETIFEARQNNVRVYFQKEGDIVKIIAVCLRRDQTKTIRLLKEFFK